MVKYYVLLKILDEEIIKRTLTSNDLGHVFAAGHRHALGHVLALLGPGLVVEGVGGSVEGLDDAVGHADDGGGVYARGRTAGSVLEAEHRQLEGEGQGALVLDGATRPGARTRARSAPRGRAGTLHLREQTRRHLLKLNSSSLFEAITTTTTAHSEALFFFSSWFKRRLLLYLLLT